MSTDTESREPAGRRIPRRHLPKIVDLIIERVPFEPPKYEFVESVYAGYREALAFIIEVDGVFRQDRAVTPVLYVGEVEISHLENLGNNRYRFLAFEEERRMKKGDSIALGWPGLPKEKQETKFRFQPPE